MIGPILFLVLSYIIYRDIQNQPNLRESRQIILDSISGKGKWLVILLVVLMFLNWGIEALKWQILIRPVQKINYLKSLKAVLSGISFALFIPVGDYLGRLLYMKEGNRLRSVSLNIAGSMSQLIITLLAGIVGIFYLRSHVLQPKMQLGGLSEFWLDALVYVIVSGSLVLVMIYFKLSRITTLLEKVPFIYRYRFFIEGLEHFTTGELTRILLLSFCRYCIFIVQYLLVLHIFGVGIAALNAMSATSVLFLVLALIPSITIAELGVRGEVSIQLFGLLSVNSLGIVASAALIWVVNLIIPALAGSIFILSIKIFRNK